MEIEGVHNVRQAVFSHFSSHFQAQVVDRPSVANLSFRRLSVSEGGGLILPCLGASVKGTPSPLSYSCWRQKDSTF